jgi:hypothetical protein
MYKFTWRHRVFCCGRTMCHLPVTGQFYLCQTLTIGIPNGCTPISIAILENPSVSMLWLNGKGGKYLQSSRCIITEPSSHIIEFSSQCRIVGRHTYATGVVHALSM